ncbi:MAG TPA: MFS transporter [Vicinamibacterales bacterium]|jgi:MFS family permease
MTEASLDTRPQPTRLFRWMVLTVISFAAFGNYYVFDCIGPLANLLSKQLGFSDANIGLLQAIYSFPNVVMVLIGGVIIDRIGTKKSTLIFGVICFVGASVTALTPTLPVMATGRLIYGLGAESLTVAVTTAIARWFRGKELSFGFGINLTLSRFGSLAAQVSPTWAAWAYTSWTWPLYMAVAFATFCVIGALGYWLLESLAERRYNLGTIKTDKVVLKDIFKFDRSYWYIVALCVTFYSGIFPFQTFAQKYFVEAHHASPKEASMLVGMLTIFAMVGTPLFGLLVDRIGRRSLLMMFGSMLLIPVYLIMAYSDLPLGVPMAMMGIAFSLIPAVMWPSVAYVVDESRLGTAYGLMTMVQNIGLFGFNLLIGWANDTWHASATNPGGYTAGMWMFSCLGLLGLLFASLLRRSDRARARELAMAATA